MNNQFLEDRALSEHRGSAMLVKKASGKFSLLMPLQGLGEVGSPAEALEKTAVGNKQKSYEEGRIDNAQKTLAFYVHRDNVNIIKGLEGTEQTFLRLLPDFTAYSFKGKISYKVADPGVGALENGEMTITPTSSETYIENAYDLIEDTAIITSRLPEFVTISGTGTSVLDIETLPSDATIAVASDKTAVATVAYATGKVTITGVTSGSAIIKITSTKTGYADFVRTVLAIIK